MKNVAIMDTSIMSFNLGDQIIMESARKGLKSVIKDDFVVNMPTHSPLFHRYEFSIRKNDSFKNSLNQIDYKFVCGTNLLEKNMSKRKNSWNMNILDLRYINDFILVGVGTDGLNKVQNRYTKKFYQKALNGDFYHSVRDEKTKKFLESIGIKAINTGCVTLWGFTPEYCNTIPTKKAASVIFTITDYMQDIESDRYMINVLLSNYDSVYCWIQGINDLNYLESLNISGFNEKVQIIAPSLESYSYFLSTNECDYVGTRLHAGIKAMQMRKRAIIIGVDNRAKDINIDYNLNYIDRLEICHLDELINSEFTTKISIHQDRIKKFLGQFI